MSNGGSIEMAPPPEGVVWACEEMPPDVARCMAPASFEPMDRRDMRTSNNRRHVWKIYAQLNGHCTANATCQCILVAREKMGLPRKLLSPEMLYHQHSRWGAGSTLQQNLVHARDVGVIYYPDGGYTEQNQRLYSNPNNWPADWREMAKENRILEWEDLHGDVDLILTALQLGFPVILGITWPGGGGHAIEAQDVVMDSRDDPLLMGPNSWDERWNGDGWWKLRASRLRNLKNYGAWCLRVATTPPVTAA